MGSVVYSVELVCRSLGAWQDTTKLFARAAQHALTVGGEDCVCDSDCIFMIAASSSAVTLPRGGIVTVTLNLSCIAPGGLVELAASGVPVGVVASFDTNLTAGSN